MKKERAKRFVRGAAQCSIALAIALAATTLASCAKTDKAATADTKLKVTVTFNALAEIARAVGGEYADVSTIIPDGVEPHDFEPKAQDMKTVSDADVFVYNGLGLERWVPQSLEAAGNKNLIAVDASEGAEAIGSDPHLWLSLKGAEIETKNMASAFAKADPEHAGAYAKNAEDYIASLEALYAEYADKIRASPLRVIVTGHAAFGYLCRDFGLEQNSVEDVFAEGEPSPQQLASLVEYARGKKVKTIFAEQLASPEVSKTLADEIGAKVKTIYTIESAEDGKTYIERMRSNLESICASLNE